MSILAHLALAAADVGQAAVAHSEFAYASQADRAKARAKASNCTPCAAGARLERAQAITTAHITGGPVQLPKRPRKALAP